MGDALDLKILYLGYDTNWVYAIEHDGTKTNVALFRISRSLLDVEDLYRRIDRDRRRNPDKYTDPKVFPSNLNQWVHNEGLYNFPPSVLARAVRHSDGPDHVRPTTNKAASADFSIDPRACLFLSLDAKFLESDMVALTRPIRMVEESEGEKWKIGNDSVVRHVECEIVEGIKNAQSGGHFALTYAAPSTNVSEWGKRNPNYFLTLDKDMEKQTFLMFLKRENNSDKESIPCYRFLNPQRPLLDFVELRTNSNAFVFLRWRRDDYIPNWNDNAEILRYYRHIARDCDLILNLLEKDGSFSKTGLEALIAFSRGVLQKKGNNGDVLKAPIKSVEDRE